MGCTVLFQVVCGTPIRQVTNDITRNLLVDNDEQFVSVIATRVVIASDEAGKRTKPSAKPREMDRNLWSLARVWHVFKKTLVSSYAWEGCLLLGDRP